MVITGTWDNHIADSSIMSSQGEISMLHPSVRVELSSIEGKGLIAQDVIPKDTIVWELDSNHTKYTRTELLKLPLEMQLLCYWAGDCYICVYDNSEYMNHSCDPNCWFLGDTMMVARRTILPREELTFEYATSEVDSSSHDYLTCLCHSDFCRGRLRTDDILMPELQRLYEGHLPSWTVDFIHQHQLERV